MTTVLVTGAGGSIGSDLSRRISADRLVLVDRAESALYDVGLEVPSAELALVDLTDRARTRRLMERVRPDVVYHVAAYKHVPLMEAHPSEAVMVNVGGTLSVLDAAEAAEVPRLVLVSTDKAVEPMSVMGATKRIAEWLVAGRARAIGRAYVSVRFGNVIGTAGSVIPLFRWQLARGLPLTVTDPDATRYFLPLGSASELVLTAARLGSARGETFLPDMGQPVRIRDLARQVAIEEGQPNAPIVYVGLRPGERLHERLVHDYEVPTPTEVEGVSVILSVGAPPDLDTAGLLDLADGEHDEQLRERLSGLVREVSLAA